MPHGNSRDGYYFANPRAAQVIAAAGLADDPSVVRAYLGEDTGVGAMIS
jgi:hypothetical protein